MRYHNIKSQIQLIIFTLLLLAMPSTHAEKTTLWQASAGEEKINLVELYTSQGCHSCPPAEKLVNNLENNPALWKKIIPLAFHVDYWNYLGWKDPFSKSQYSNRQQRHRFYGNVRSVYTPGWLVNGKEWRGFFRRHPIPKNSASKTLPLLAQLKGGYLRISIPYDTNYSGPKPTKIYTALLGSGYEHTITAGENNGKKLTSNFTVLNLSDHTMKFTNHWTVPIPKVRDTQGSTKMALAVWLSDKQNRPIQAVGNWIDEHLIIDN